MPKIESQARKQNHSKIKQPYQAVIVVLINIPVCLLLFLYKPYLPGIWVFGLAFGFILQRSRFCFAASFRDLILLRNSSLMRAVLLSMMLSTTGYLLLQVFYFGYSSQIGYIFPVGFHTVFGAFMFGLGMVVAGGCASGALMRMGEGYLMQWITFIGLIIGSVVGSFSFGWWEEVSINKSPYLFLPEIVGWPAASGIQLLALLSLYFFLKKFD